MVIDVNIYPAIDRNFRASVSGAGDTHWLSIQSGTGSISVFASADHLDALKMIADVFNDAFQPKAETPPEPAPAVSRDLDDDIPF